MNYISTTSNQALMAQALKSLIGKWGIAIGAWFVFFILTDLQVGWEWQGDDGGGLGHCVSCLSGIARTP